MTSLKSEFKLWDKGFKNTLVFIPGWATDYRIFEPLALNYNYLFPIKFYPFHFKEELSKFLRKNSLSKVSLLGWSMGGFLVTDFALRNPKRVHELILLSIRKSFNSKALEEIKELLKKNKKAYLYKFYLECFSVDDEEGRLWFKKHLLKDYLHERTLKDLLDGLDYLSGARICAQSLSGFKKIKIFHGEKDAIAPLKESLEIKSGLPQAQFISLPTAGHILFLNSAFRKKISHG